MSKIKENILDISHNHCEYLINLKNVQGIGLGHKFINGKDTNEPCIHVLVEEKVDSKYISKDNLVPKSYMGIKTDVIRVGKVKPRDGVAVPYIFRPLEGGCAISIGSTMEDGTLGCILTRNSGEKREYFILSNNHVLALKNTVPIGSPIIQPSIALRANVKKHIIAVLATYVRLKFNKGFYQPANYMDCALGRIIDNSIVSNEIHLIGEITGVAKPALKMPVRKVGFVSGLTNGQIISMGVSVPIPYTDTLTALFKDQILCTLDNDAGDSGAVVVDDSNKVLGLFHSGTDDGYAYFSDIEDIYH